MTSPKLYSFLFSHHQKKVLKDVYSRSNQCLWNCKTLASSCSRLAKTLPSVHSLRQRGIADVLIWIGHRYASSWGTYLSGLSSQFFQSGLTGNSARAVGHSTGAIWEEMDSSTLLTLLRGKSVQRKKPIKLQKKLNILSWWVSCAPDLCYLLHFERKAISGGH